MHKRLWTAFVVAMALMTLVPSQADELRWRTLQPGVEFAALPAGRMASGAPGELMVVRVDPGHAKLTVALASEQKSSPKTAAEWCESSRLSVAINVGMYQNDHRSNVGYLRHGSHLNNKRWNEYQAVLALNPDDPALPALKWIDRDQPNGGQPATGYDIAIQNLRLIAREGRNVWSPSKKRWSEAALAIDSSDRLLFLFTRAPWSMHEFNEFVLGLPLDIKGAMHLEGGPEASLSIHAGGIDLDLAGSYESGFQPDDSNVEQWAIPNVLGVLREE